jgi:thioredoxin 1
MELVTNVVKQSLHPKRLMLLMHGFGSDERDLAALAPYLDPNGHLLIVCPQGPLKVPGAGYSWYDLMNQEQFDAAMFLETLDALDDLLDAQCIEHGLDRRAAIIAGFSQGGSMAYALGYRISARPRPAGIVALSGFLLEDIAGLAYAFGDDDLPPAFVAHGTQDPMLPLERGRKAALTLDEHGIPLVYREYKMQHQVALEEIEDLKAWVDAVEAGERPSEPLPVSMTAPPAPGADEAADDGPIASVTTRTFEEEVLKSPVPVIVDFWAPWCGPCKQVAPVLAQIASMRGGAYKVVKVNIDENPELAQAFKVQSIPLIAMFRNGRLERQVLGAKPRQQIEAELGMLVIP